MEQQVKKQSRFYQTRMNQAKLGAYYTDQAHCKWISQLLEFPSGSEVCALEPSIGDASAVVRITGRKGNPNILIFGVELNEATAKQAMGNPFVAECLHGNFLTDVAIGRNFSFGFVNPPYGEEDGKRLELKFLEKTISCLREQAVCVFVTPYYVAAETSFLKTWSTNFSTGCYYRFREPEFGKWKQVVLIGRKIKSNEEALEQMQAMQSMLKTPEKIPLIPEKHEGEKIRVPPSLEKEIREFTTIKFDAKKGLNALKGSALDALVKERIHPGGFIAEHLSRPPLMPNAGQMYLMAVSGAGQGRVGTAREGDQHLQRGAVKNVEESEIRKDENGKLVEAVQKFAKITFHILEDDGNIHTL